MTKYESEFFNIFNYKGMYRVIFKDAEAIKLKLGYTIEEEDIVRQAYPDLKFRCSDINTWPYFLWFFFEGLTDESIGNTLDAEAKQMLNAKKDYIASDEQVILCKWSKLDVAERVDGLLRALNEHGAADKLDRLLERIGKDHNLSLSDN